MMRIMSMLIRVKFSSPQTYGFGNQYGNPVAAAYYRDNYEKRNKLIFSIYAEFNIITDKLTFKTSYNSDLDFYTNRNYTPEFNVGGSQGVRRSSLTKTSGNSSKQIIDNFLTYKNTLRNQSYTIFLGQSTRIEKWEYLSGSALNVPGIDESVKISHHRFFQRPLCLG